MDGDKGSSIELQPSRAGYTLYEHNGEACIADKGNSKNAPYCEDLFIAAVARKEHTLVKSVIKTGKEKETAVVKRSTSRSRSARRRKAAKTGPEAEEQMVKVKQRARGKTTAEAAAVSPRRVAKHPLAAKGMRSTEEGRTGDFCRHSKGCNVSSHHSAIQLLKKHSGKSNCLRTMHRSFIT